MKVASRHSPRPRSMWASRSLPKHGRLVIAGMCRAVSGWRARAPGLCLPRRIGRVQCARLPGSPAISVASPALCLLRDLDSCPCICPGRLLALAAPAGGSLPAPSGYGNSGRRRGLAPVTSRIRASALAIRAWSCARRLRGRARSQHHLNLLNSLHHLHKRRSFYSRRSAVFRDMRE